MIEPFQLRRVDTEGRLKRHQEIFFDLKSPHHEQLLEVRLFPSQQAASFSESRHLSEDTVKIFGADWSIQFSHFESIAEAWFGVSLSEYEGVLKEWIFDLIPICLQQDFELHAISIGRLEQNVQSEYLSHRYLLQCLVGQSLIGQSLIEVNIDNATTAAALAAALDFVSFPNQPKIKAAGQSLIPTSIPPMILHIDVGSFNPFNSNQSLLMSSLTEGSVWILDHVNFNAQGLFERCLGSARVSIDLNLESTQFGVISMLFDEENSQDLSLIKDCLSIEQHVVVRAGSLTLTLEQISRLRRGELIVLPHCDFPMVRLMNGDIEIGRGEMVECDGKPAIQIVDIYQRGSPL
ncbi:FliM/FliN family flagellar motor switch protein [Limnobacter alexandrii]|uniref:FliM/FliN family flagellar motor switch protein n=1 Tax=Limnobacter alexandrii TaxID=2570352 RepID=UPI0011091289|nr:FliM/FliN family flagellar motor switch protein [Limnobacter alexandrii]